MLKSLMLGLASAFLLVAASAPPPPNFLFVLIDDLGFNDVGFHNRSADGTVAGRGIMTPIIDQLADTGLKLTNYYVHEMCTPTRGALMTGRYPFRYGATAYTIGSDVPWGIPLDEVFLPQMLKPLGYTTAIAGKWHLGFFKPDFTPTNRGFDYQHGLFNGKADHFYHFVGEAPLVGEAPKPPMGQIYDWKVNDTTDLSYNGTYSGTLVKNAAVSFIEAMAASRTPFFFYAAFQEVHAPLQVDSKYSDMYPHLKCSKDECDNGDTRATLAGMITHTDEMIGDIMDTLRSTGVYNNTIVICSSDNGGPTIDYGHGYGNGPATRFDMKHSERNWPLRGQKHEIFEGGVRSFGIVHSPLLPASLQGASHSALVHVTDWFPTIVSLARAGGDWTRLLSEPEVDYYDYATEEGPQPKPLDGHAQWACFIDGGHNASGACPRDEVVLNIDLECDTPHHGTLPPNTNTSCSKQSFTAKECIVGTLAPPVSPNTNPFHITKQQECCSACDKQQECVGWSVSAIKEQTAADVEAGSGMCTLLASIDKWTESKGCLGCATKEPLPTGDIVTECPAPKSGIRMGEMKLLVECMNHSHKNLQGPLAISGRRMLFNLTADPGEEHDLNLHTDTPGRGTGRLVGDWVDKMSARLLELGKSAVAPMLKKAPWQGQDYWCAKCHSGKPHLNRGNSSNGGSFNSWEPWCSTPGTQTCNSTGPSCTSSCAASGCNCDCYCKTCKGNCGDGCYQKCIKATGKSSSCNSDCVSCSCK